MVKEMISDTKSKMNKAVDHTASELQRVRTGRANPNLLDSIKVNYYGALTPLKQLAAVSAPEPRMMVVQPFDASVVSEIHKSIQSADLGFSPQIDGKMLRIPIPALSQERRAELVKLVKKVVEEGRVSIRNIRRDGNESIKKSEKDKEITEDDKTKGLDEVQKLTDEYIKQLDQISENKEKELLS